MTDPQPREMFAHKGVPYRLRAGEPRLGFADVHRDPRIVRLYREHYAIVRVRVRPALDEEDTPYWGWWAADDAEYRHIYPSPHGTEMCFPYGSEAEEERGRGKKLRLLIEEVGPA